MNKFEIGWLLPDTMFLHGERGNVLALARYAELAGLEHEITKIDLGKDDFDPFRYDVLFMAPGEISVFPEVVEWLSGYKDELTRYMEEGHPLIVTGTSCGVFFDEVKRDGGETVKGLGMIHSIMEERDHVEGDDLIIKATYAGREMELIGSEISMADIFTGDERPFGLVTYGYGNNGKDKTEGIIKENSVFTNLLGPLLVTDPWLTVEIVKAGALANGIRLCDVTGSEISPDSFDMTLEKKSFELKKKYNLSKPAK